MTIEELKPHIEIIRNLDPKPGGRLNPSPSQYVTPDVFIVKVEDQYEVMLNDDGLPQLRINPIYKRLIDKGAGETNDETRAYVKDKFRSALWLLKSVDQRQKTIYKVARSIVDFQTEFLDHGIEHLKPLVLRDVANDIGMHESTVSRVVNNKYMHTPQGVFEMKYFFHSGISSSYGENVSSVTIKQRIKKIIEVEDAQAPAQRFEDRQHPAEGGPGPGPSHHRQVSRGAAASRRRTSAKCCTERLRPARSAVRAKDARSPCDCPSPAVTSTCRRPCASSSRAAWSASSGCSTTRSSRPRSCSRRSATSTGRAHHPRPRRPHAVGHRRRHDLGGRRRRGRRQGVDPGGQAQGQVEDAQAPQRRPPRSAGRRGRRARRQRRRGAAACRRAAKAGREAVRVTRVAGVRMTRYAVKPMDLDDAVVRFRAAREPFLRLLVGRDRAPGAALRAARRAPRAHRSGELAGAAPPERPHGRRDCARDRRCPRAGRRSPPVSSSRSSPARAGSTGRVGNPVPAEDGAGAGRLRRGAAGRTRCSSSGRARCASSRRAWTPTRGRRPSRRVFSRGIACVVVTKQLEPPDWPDRGRRHGARAAAAHHAVDAASPSPSSARCSTTGWRRARSCHGVLRRRARPRRADGGGERHRQERVRARADRPRPPPGRRTTSSTSAGAAARSSSAPVRR